MIGRSAIADTSHLTAPLRVDLIVACYASKIGHVSWSFGCKGCQMEQEIEAIRQAPQFRVGGSDEALALLWGRGDEPEEIAARFKISLDVVEKAIQLYGHNYPKRPKRRRRRI
jgi:hypothetical protein